MAGQGGSDTLTGTEIVNATLESGPSILNSTVVGISGATATNVIGQGFFGMNVLTGAGGGTLTGKSVTDVTGTWSLGTMTDTPTVRRT